jgi:SAM-dependent methyltransferase
MTRQQVLRGIKVGETDFVIDIGGGHRPFWRANLVIEKYPFDHSRHRTQPMQFPGVPVIKADALALPVPDGGCDLIFASHIIEHLPDPKRFVDEIRRCSRRVYLEFPARNRELMNAWSFHEWLVEARGTVLRFYRNDLPQLFGPLFHEEHDAALGAWSEARHEHLNTSVYCRSEEIQCEFPNETATQLVLRDAPRGDAKLNVAEAIHRPPYSLREVLAFAAQSMLPNNVYERLVRLRESASSPAPLPNAVLARLMCFECRGAALSRTADALVCRCGARYRQDRGVFDFDTQMTRAVGAGY